MLFFFSILPPGRTVALIVTANGSNDVFPPKDGPFGGLDDGWRHMGKIFPKSLEALPGVAYPGFRDNRSTLNTKTGF